MESNSQRAINREALTIQDYFKASGVRINKETERRLRQILKTAKGPDDIKLWLEQEPKLHEILKMDYQELVKQRITMNKL